MKPLPIIHLSKAQDHARLANALYALGYDYCGASVGQGIRMYLRDTKSSVTDDMVYAWMALETGAGFTAYRTREDAGPTYTTVNSIAHFIAYTRSLGAPSQDAGYEADAFDGDEDLDGN